MAKIINEVPKQRLRQVPAKRSQIMMDGTLVNGSSIIKIIPAGISRGKIPVKRQGKTYIVDQSKKVKLVRAPSTSAPQEEQNKYDEIEDFEPFEVVTSRDANYEETKESDTDEQDVFIEVKQPTASSFSTVPSRVNKTHSEQCCCSCRETLDIILQQQQEILKYLKKNDKSIIPLERKLDLLPPMPFNDINDFLDFDESLTSNGNVQDQFLIKLKRLLVSQEQKSVSNIMSSILTNELSKSISWTGIKDSVMFSSSNMVTLIIDLVQEHHNLDIDVIKSRIAEWLRRCGDRIANEMRRSKKKLDQTPSS